MDSIRSNIDMPNCITAEEGKKMRADFDKYLNNFSVQVDELRKQNKVLYERFETEAFRNDALRNSINNAKHQNVILGTEIDKKSSQLSSLESQMQNEIHIPESFSNLLYSISNPQDLSYDQLNKFSIELVSYLEKLEISTTLLETQSELLSKKVDELNKKINTEMKCVNCGKMYMPSMNDAEDCVFHPGKLRYFSCRGCGADAYYQCCSKCVKCSAGCKTAKHCS